jgi:hypothetical protein
MMMMTTTTTTTTMMMMTPIGTGKNLPHFYLQMNLKHATRQGVLEGYPVPGFPWFFGPSRKPLPSESFEFINHHTIRCCISYTVAELWPEPRRERTQLQRRHMAPNDLMMKIILNGE